MGPFAGKQLWIWELNQCLNGNVALIVQVAKALGCRGLILKAWDGSDYADWVGQVQQLVGPAHAAGLLVNAWGYSRANSISGEVAAMVAAVKAGADALIIDAEVEYDVATGGVLATNLFAALARSPVAYAGYGFTSFAFPDDHPQFPWRTFAQNCYAQLPQVYFGDLSMSPHAALTQSLSQYAKHGLVIPSFPVGQAYDNPAIHYFANAADIQAFAAAVKAEGLGGYSFWSLQHMLIQLQAITNL